MMEDTDTRSATVADIAAIMEIETACFGSEAFNARQMRYLITSAKGVFYIAYCRESILGYISFLQSRLHNTGRIYSIAVSPGCRGRGLGGVLIDKAVEEARARSLSSVFLEVAVDNASAIALYRNKGFVKSCLKRGYYDDGTDAYAMVLRLE